MAGLSLYSKRSCLILKIRFTPAVKPLTGLFLEDCLSWDLIVHFFPFYFEHAIPFDAYHDFFVLLLVHLQLEIMCLLFLF